MSVYVSLESSTNCVKNGPKRYGARLAASASAVRSFLPQHIGEQRCLSRVAIGCNAQLFVLRFPQSSHSADRLHHIFYFTD
jgi:hypothetical protein